MLDSVQLNCIAGDGGPGKVSFRREKYVPKGGPDGGDGGDGGSVILRGVDGLATLRHFSGVKTISAQSGEPGGKRKRHGKDGQDTIVEVPFGTMVWVLAENEVARERRAQEGAYRAEKAARKQKYFVEKEGEQPPRREAPPLQTPSGADYTYKRLDLKQVAIKQLPDTLELVTISPDNPEFVLCEGGRGGRGNTAFKGPEKTTPLEAEYGTFGEQRVVLLELKLLADVGLVGFPNAGKSTFLSAVSNAKPKIASYPFTTLQPQLGVVQVHGTEFVLADIPGLVEQASKGKGLGYQFLRHIEACQSLLYLLFVEDSVLATGDGEQIAEGLWRQWQQLEQELQEYNELLTQKRSVVRVSKADIYPVAMRRQVVDFFKKKGVEVAFVSAATGEGMQETLAELAEERFAKE